MKRILSKHKEYWSDRGFLTSAFVGLIALLGSFVVNYRAGIYATRQVSNKVTDLFLDHLPTWNVSFIFVDGILLFIVVLAVLLLLDPKRIPFTLKAIALFVLVRSIFITLTHIAPEVPSYAFWQQVGDNDILPMFTFGGDLFFSGHTGLPFLAALIFWDRAWLRNIFIVSSLIFGASVLLGHLHYSIDVFAAFFITDSVFRISTRWFRKDYARSNAPSA